MIKIGEFKRVAKKEDRSVVADQIPITLFGIEFNGKATYITLSIRGPALTGNRGKASEKFSFLTNLRKNFGPGIAGNVMGYGKGTVGPRSLGMHPPLGNNFTVKMGQLFQEPDILQ